MEHKVRILNDYLTVTKRFRNISYAHSLPGYHGDCKNVHGHDGVLEITVSGPPRDVTPLEVYNTMVVDFKDLKRIVERYVIQELDHQYLNHVIGTPTAENIVMWIYKRLKPHFGKNIKRIRFYETDDSWAELSL